MSISPGMTVLPAASISSAPSGGCTPGPAAVMRRPSISTVEFGTGAAPVPSQSAPPVIA